MPTCSHVEYGGTLQFRCETPDYPHFEVLFEIPDAFGNIQTVVFPGSIDHPVIIPVAEDSEYFKSEGEYRYLVHHHRKKPEKGDPPYTGPDTGTGNVFVRHCNDCR
jgi:hypothetical protein